MEARVDYPVLTGSSQTYVGGVVSSTRYPAPAAATQTVSNGAAMSSDVWQENSSLLAPDATWPGASRRLSSCVTVSLPQPYEREVSVGLLMP